MAPSTTGMSGLTNNGRIEQSEAVMVEYFGNMKRQVSLFLFFVFLSLSWGAVVAGADGFEMCWSLPAASYGAGMFVGEFSYVYDKGSASGRFELVKSGSEVLDEVCWNPGVQLPESDAMVAGEFRYNYKDDKEDYGTRGCKAAVLVEGKTIHYVASMMKKNEKGLDNVFEDTNVYDACNETNYGVYGKYLVMDSWAYGSVSGHNRRMFLFKYGKDTVELLDVIDDIFDFSSFGRERIYENKEGMYWMDIKDFDNDGNPEIKVVVTRNQFVFFIEIKDDRLRVDLNPVLYRQSFKEQKRKNSSKKKKNTRYYLSGFFSGALTLNEIKAAIKSSGERYYGQYDYVAATIKSRDTWDREFHDYGGVQPTLLRYEIEGRQ